MQNRHKLLHNLAVPDGWPAFFWPSVNGYVFVSTPMALVSISRQLSPTKQTCVSRKDERWCFTGVYMKLRGATFYVHPIYIHVWYQIYQCIFEVKQV